MKIMLKGMRDTISGIYPDYRILTKYFSTGMVATLADWIVCFALMGIFNVYFLVARVFSYTSGMMISFSLNKRYTFDNKYAKYHHQLIIFAAIAIIGLLMNELIMYILVKYIFVSTGHIFQYVSVIIATVTVFFFNYIANKYLTFRIFT